MKYRILSTSPTFGYYAFEPFEYLKSHDCKVELVPQDKKLSERELIGEVTKYDAMIAGTNKITESIIRASKRLRVIAKHGAGIDNIDVKAASNRGIVILNTPGANSNSVADLAIGLIISLARKIPFADRCVREGGWPRIVGIDLSGKTLGIIGLGQIGKKVAKRALGFDMKVLAYDIFEDKDFARQLGVTYLSLDEVIAESDFLSIHIPMTPLTRQLIGRRELELMKRKAFLINISRGDVVDEERLYQALKEKRIQGAALDVFSSEPPKGSPLLMLDNVIVSPHVGGITFEALRETGMMCAHGIIDILEGRQPHNVVNPEVLK